MLLFWNLLVLHVNSCTNFWALPVYPYIGHFRAKQTRKKSRTWEPSSRTYEVFQRWEGRGQKYHNGVQDRNYILTVYYQRTTFRQKISKSSTIKRNTPIKVQITSFRQWPSLVNLNSYQMLHLRNRLKGHWRQCFTPNIAIYWFILKTDWIFKKLSQASVVHSVVVQAVDW